jgi:hypothetical protein
MAPHARSGFSGPQPKFFATSLKQQAASFKRQAASVKLQAFKFLVDSLKP